MTDQEMITAPQADAPELAEGQVWVAPNGRRRTILRYAEDYGVDFLNGNGKVPHWWAPQTFLAWVRSSDARPA